MNKEQSKIKKTFLIGFLTLLLFCNLEPGVFILSLVLIYSKYNYDLEGKLKKIMKQKNYVKVLSLVLFTFLFIIISRPELPNINPISPVISSFLYGLYLLKLLMPFALILYCFSLLINEKEVSN